MLHEKCKPITFISNNYYTHLAGRTIILGFQTFYFLSGRTLLHCVIGIKEYNDTPPPKKPKTNQTKKLNKTPKNKTNKKNKHTN